MYNFFHSEGSIINMDHIRYAKISSPAENIVLSDFGDEALDFSGVFADVCEAFAVAELAASSVNQIHVNCMPHEVIASFRGFDNGTAD